VGPDELAGRRASGTLPPPPLVYSTGGGATRDRRAGDVRKERQRGRDQDEQRQRHTMPWQVVVVSPAAHGGGLPFAHH